MARPKSNGAYAKLSSTYYFDDAVLEAGERAEVIWTRILAFLSTSKSDGFITERQIRALALKLRGVEKRVDLLTEVGLLERVPGGFVARSWLKWNKTAQQLDQELARDRERKARKSGEEPGNSERNPDGNESNSAAQYKDSSVQDSPVQKTTPRKRGTRLDERWVPEDALIAQMRDECPGVDLRAEHRVFVDYWIAQPGQKGVKADWDATWRNWMRRKAADVRPGRAAPPSRGQQREAELLAFATAADPLTDTRQEITS